jgi:hypothetical protein
MRGAGQITHMGERRVAYNVLVGKPDRKRPLGKTWHRWEDDIKMHLQEVGWGALTEMIWLRIQTGGGHL